MLNRRRFLQVLTSGAVGLSFVDVQWSPTPIVSTRPLETDLIMGLEQITAAVAREIGRVLNIRGVFVPGDYALGMAGMTDQFSIDAGIDEQTWSRGVGQQEIIVPIARGLAQRVRDRGLRRFGALPMPHLVEDGLVATDEVTGVTVRGIRAWDIGRTYMQPIYKPRNNEDPVGDEDGLEVIGEELVESPPRWVTRFDILAGH